MTEDNMQDNVVRPEFKSIEGGGEKPKAKVELAYSMDDVIEASDIDAIKLPSPQYGEKQIGVLTDDEAIMFVGFWRANEVVSKLDREIAGTLLENLGRSVRTGDIDVSNPENWQGQGFDVPEEKAIEFFRWQSYMAYMKNQFYWTVGERLNCHEYRQAVRSNRRFITKDRKFGNRG